jgi:hypothetical protein
MKADQSKGRRGGALRTFFGRLIPVREPSGQQTLPLEIEGRPPPEREKSPVARQDRSLQYATVPARKIAVIDDRQGFLAFFAGDADGQLMTDSEGRIHQANDAAGTLLNTSPRLLVDQPLAAFVSLDSRPAFHEQLARVRTRTTEQITDWELDLQPLAQSHVRATIIVGSLNDVKSRLNERHTPAGESFTVLADLAPIRDHANTLLGFRWRLRRTPKKLSKDAFVQAFEQTQAGLERRVNDLAVELAKTTEENQRETTEHNSLKYALSRTQAELQNQTEARQQVELALGQAQAELQIQTDARKRAELTVHQAQAELQTETNERKRAELAAHQAQAELQIQTDARTRAELTMHQAQAELQAEANERKRAELAAHQARAELQIQTDARTRAEVAMHQAQAERQAEADERKRAELACEQARIMWERRSQEDADKWAATNVKLQRDLDEFIQKTRTWQQANLELERQLKDQTIEWAKANTMVRAEVAKRRQLNQALRRNQARARKVTADVNTRKWAEKRFVQVRWRAQILGRTDELARLSERWRIELAKIHRLERQPGELLHLEPQRTRPRPGKPMRLTLMIRKSDLAQKKLVAESRAGIAALAQIRRLIEHGPGFTQPKPWLAVGLATRG